MAIFFKLLFLPLIALSSENSERSEISPLSKSVREQIYEENGLDFARQLYLENDGQIEDEVRTKKSDALNQKIRQKGIDKLEAKLSKNRDQRLRRELLLRLVQMYEQQAEITNRRSDLKNRELQQQQTIKKAIQHLLTLHKEFPQWHPDAILFGLAENYAKIKEQQAAEGFYRDIIRKYGNSPVVADSLLALGNLYFDRRLFETARGFYKKILDTEEINLHPYAHYKVAWCYFNEKDNSSAINGLEKAILESRKISKGAGKKLGVEDEALSDLVLFHAENGNPAQAKEHLERLVDKEKSSELRFQLARKLFDDGKHQLAGSVARQLLGENPTKEYISKLYLILISVAERSKARGDGLESAERLSAWIKKEAAAKDNVSRVETEEYLRHYSQKLHYEAETLKQRDIWDQARKSYEIYLNTFPEESETPEVKFRYSVLLLNLKKPLPAFKAVNESLAKMERKHPRFHEALKLRLQAIELLSKDERNQIQDSEILTSYDAFAENSPNDDLGVEAAFKAASIAKSIEKPEKAAARFRNLVEKNPKHSLATIAIGESLSVLVKAESWDLLSQYSRNFSASKEVLEGQKSKDESLLKKLSEARELANVKLTENLEKAGKILEAKSEYERILGENISDNLGIFAHIKLAGISEQKLNRNRDAINYYLELRKRYPLSKEARESSLELARLYEKVNEPRESARYYQDFAKTGAGKKETQALANSALILETLNEREAAAEAFFQLSEKEKGQKERMAAYDAACTNLLIASLKNRSSKLLRGVHSCSIEMAGQTEQKILWQARAAWASDQMKDGLSSDSGWRKLAAKNMKAGNQEERTYLALAKLKLLTDDLAQFKRMHFSKTNERPEANLGNKTRAMEEIERKAEMIIKIGTGKQILSARSILRSAYTDFAETMETAAVPSKLGSQEQEELKKSFMEFAKGFREKANLLEVKEETAQPSSSQIRKEEEMLSAVSLSKEESNWLEEGNIPAEKAAEIYAKKAISLFQDGKYGDARYFGEKWRKTVSAGAPPGFGEKDFEKFQAQLVEKIPAVDPLSQDL